MWQWIGRFEPRDPYQLVLAAAVVNTGQFSSCDVRLRGRTVSLILLRGLLEATILCAAIIV
jgi:hypothetical protein